MNQVSLAYGLLAQGYDVEFMVLTHRLAEVKFAFKLVFFHHCVVVFMANLFFHKAIPLVFLSVCTHIASVLRLDTGEIQNF